MKHILFSELSNQIIDTALIDAITLDTYALKVIIKHNIYQVHNDDTSIYYTNCLKTMHDELAYFAIEKVFLHESLSFHPSLGFNGMKDKDLLLDKDFKPARVNH